MAVDGTERVVGAAALSVDSDVLVYLKGMSARLDWLWLWLGASGARGGCAAHSASSCAEPLSERSEPRRRPSPTAQGPPVAPGFFFT